MYGDFVTVIEAPELNTTVAILASVINGAIAKEVGVIPMPIRATLSFYNHLLNNATCIVGYAAIVPHKDFNSSPSHDIAVLLDIKLDRGRKLPTDGVKTGASHRDADSDFEDVLRFRETGVTVQQAARSEALENCPSQHRASSDSFWMQAFLVASLFRIIKVRVFTVTAGKPDPLGDGDDRA